MFGLKRKNKHIKELRNVTATFLILDELARRGLVFWRQKDHVLLIEESFALVKLSEGEQGFRRFLEQVTEWQSYHNMQDAYEKARIEVETKAVREAKKEHPQLTDMDARRIRQHARQNMEEIPLEALNVVSSFDIMVIRASAPSVAEASKEGGQLLAVGHYDGKAVEMAMFDEVKDVLMNT